MRRTLVFMVKQGFALSDLKSLYIDEFREYYCEVIYTLEESKALPEGTYDKARGIDRSGEKLSQLFKIAKNN